MNNENDSLTNLIKSKHFQLYFIGLWGVQILLLFLHISGFKEYSQDFTIPFRLIVVIVSLTIFLKYNLISIFWSRTTLQLIIIFYILILARIISDTFIIPKDLGTPGVTYLFRFGSMVVIPSLAFAIEINDSNASRARKGVKYSCIIFLVLGFYLYRDALGFDYRTLQHFAGWNQDELISPMMFSYIGLTLIGITIWELFYQKSYNWLNVFALLLSLFALAWGATRNSILALIIIILYISLQQTKTIKSTLKVISFWLVSSLLAFYLLELSGSHLLSRFNQLFTELSKGDMNAGSYRLEIWVNGFNQFLSNPLFGSSIEESSVKYVAHNMYLESFMSTGLLGGTLFIVICIFTFLNGKKLLKNNSPLGWLMILFLERLFTGVMSTSILDPLFWLPVIAINANSNRVI